jgi:predicted NAD/FAD-binding protein
LNDLKAVISEKGILVARLNTLTTEFEVVNSTISTLEQALDNAVFSGINPDVALSELTTATLQFQSLSRVIRNIQNNLIPIADEKVEDAQEEAQADIRAAHQTLYDKCAGDIQKKMNDILKIIQSFDIECQKVEDEARLSAGLNLPVFFIAGDDRIQFTD